MSRETPLHAVILFADLGVSRNRCMRVQIARPTCLRRRTSNRRLFTRPTERACPSSRVYKQQARKYFLLRQYDWSSNAARIYHVDFGSSCQKSLELLLSTTQSNINHLRPAVFLFALCLVRRGFLIKNVINVTNGPSEERPLRTGAWC